jgi:hypothetical protein
MATDVTLSETPQDNLMRRWFRPLLERGTTTCAPNLETTLAFLRVGEIELPLTVNEAEWENSWLCSPWTHYITYAREEIDRSVGPVTSALGGALLGTLGTWFRKAEINRVVMVNNWLHSTNPWPHWEAEDLPAVLEAMTQRWPGHAIVFRSLHAKESAPLLAALHRTGAMLVPSRQIWWYEAGSEAVVKSPDFRKDVRLLRRCDLKIVPHESILEAEIETLTELYSRLYLGKYSRHNPRYTTDWLGHLHRENLARFTALREPGGRLVGVEACTELHGVLTSPIVGYDLDQPREIGLYRRLAAVPVLEAMKRGIPLNLSAGVGRFKALRGGEPVMEYLGVYVRHLPATRRAPWRAVHELSTRLLAPHVQKHGL